jgi:hypothetical protein
MLLRHSIRTKGLFSFTYVKLISSLPKLLNTLSVSLACGRPPPTLVFSGSLSLILSDTLLESQAGLVWVSVSLSLLFTFSASPGVALPEMLWMPVTKSSHANRATLTRTLYAQIYTRKYRSHAYA